MVSIVAQWLNQICEMFWVGSRESILYHGLAIYTEVTFVAVHQAQMSTFVIEVCLWYIGFVFVFISSFHYKE